MKCLILGIITAPLALFFNNAAGFSSFLRTEAALHTVNGGGMEYQLARAITIAPDLGIPLTILSGGLIVIGIFKITKQKAKERSTQEQIDETNRKLATMSLNQMQTKSSAEVQ